MQQAVLACPWLCEHNLLLRDLNYCSRWPFKVPAKAWSLSLAGNQRAPGDDPLRVAERALAPSKCQRSDCGAQLVIIRCATVAVLLSMLVR